MSLSEKNNEAAQLVARFYAAVDILDVSVSALGVFVADNFKDHNRPVNVPAQVPDKGALLGLFEGLKVAFPDGRHSLDILEPIGDDKAMVYWTFTGTHTGPLFGKPASGNPVSINGVDIFKVANGQFVEQWHVEELMALFAQTDPRN